MFLIKPGVRLGPKPELALALAAIAVKDAFASLGAGVVITSGIEGRHMRGSKHYAGQALDFRTGHVTKSQAEAVLDSVKAALGDDFDVILEADHLHVEFDPKEPYTG